MSHIGCIILSSIYRGFIDNVIVPVYDSVRGTDRHKYGQYMDKTQWLSTEEIKKIQLKNLKALINHAYSTVPYYNQLFKEVNLHPSDFNKIDDLLKLPTLTKLNIQNNKEILLSQNIPQNQLISYHSGGTGNPIKFFITKDQVSWENAAEYRAYRWADYRLGDKCAMFWGSPFEISKQEELLKRITSWIERIHFYSTYTVWDELLRRHIKDMQSYKPEIVRGYSSAVYFVARKMLEDGVDDVRPRAVITTAESLIPEFRQTIEEAFGCKVFDYYGSREISSIASECEEHTGFHVSAENVLLEFVRDGEHVAPGEHGVILATNLRNYGMPFIRYEIGDVGRPSDESCSCGRGLPLIDSIDGRISQFISIYDKEAGKVIPVLTANPGIIAKVLNQVPVETFRVSQENLEEILIEVVPKQDYSDEHTQFVLDYLYDYIGKYIDIEIKLVEEVPPLPSGKRSVVVSKVNPFRI